MSTSEYGGSERRQFVRYKLNATAEVVIGNREMEQGEVDDISTGGMFLKLENEIPRELINNEVHAYIRANCSGGEVIIEVRCSIVRITPQGVALFFSSIDTANRSLLRDLITELYDLVHESRK